MLKFTDGWDLAEWLERLTASAKVAFSDSVESEGRQSKYFKNLESSPFNQVYSCIFMYGTLHSTGGGGGDERYLTGE